MPFLFKGLIHDISAPVAVVWWVDVRPIVTQTIYSKSAQELLSVEKETLPAHYITLCVCVCVQWILGACFVPFCSIPLTIITRHSKKGGTEADLQY